MKCIKTLGLAAGVLAGSAAVASAAVTTHALNLRAGPGLSYDVITAMPVGAFVDVDDCSNGWCEVEFRGVNGYASNRYLAEGAAVRTVPRRYYDDDGAIVYRYGPGWRYGYYDPYWDRRHARFGAVDIEIGRGWWW